MTQSHLQSWEDRQTPDHARARWTVLAAPLAIAATLSCSSPSAETATDESTTNSTTDTGATSDDATTAGSTTETTETTEEPQTTDPGTVCGDGVVDPGEDCDDGGDVNGDGCNIDCTTSATLLWEYRSESGDQSIRSLAVDPRGALIVGGRRGVDRWIARFTSEGVIEQSSDYTSGGGAETVLGLALTPTQLIAVGNSTTAPSARDFWVASLDDEGVIAWEDTYDSGWGGDWASQVAISSEGQIIVAGITSFESGTTGLITRSYDDAGALLWSESIPLDLDPNSFPLGPGMTIADRSVIVGLGKVAAVNVWPDFLVAYALTGGAPLWTHEVDGSSGSIFGLTSDVSGGLFAAGIDDSQLVVRRLAGQGEPIWSSTECQGLMGRDLAIDSQGDVVVIGYGGQPYNIRLCKFTPDGALRWGKDIDGGLNDRDLGYTVAIADNDTIIAGGSVFGDDGTDHAWLAAFRP